MAFQVSPGVVTREVDLSSIIPAVSTTVAGFAGHFQWGPADKLVTVDSENNLAALFGTPNDTNYKEWFSAANFLGYGNNLKVARVVGSSSQALNAAGPSAANSNHSLIKNEDEIDAAVTSVGISSEAGDSFLSWHARYPGALGNSIRVVWHDGGAATGDNGLDDSSEGVSASAYNSWSFAGNFQTKLPNVSGWAKTLTGVTSDNAVYDLLNVAVIDEDGLISGNAGTVLEVFDGVSKASNAKNSDGTVNYYRTVINESSRYIYATGHPELDGGFNAHGVCGGNLRWGAELDGDGGTFDVYYGSGGSTSGYSVSLSGGTGADSGTVTATGNSSGYGLFSDPDTVDVNVLICGPLSGATAKAVVELAEARKDCVAFCSPEEADVLTNGSPITQSTCETNVLDYRTNTSFNVNSSYGFLDSGWKYQYDRYNDKYRWVPLNGDVAGIAVRSDEASETWFSPAGFNRGQVRGVVKLAFNPSKTNRDNLYRDQVNPVVSFPGEGTVLFGDKTLLSKPSAFDRLNVRRLFIVLEKAISTAAKYQLFEQNDEFTRSHFRSMVEPFLRDVQARRGITDFKVICDASNNTSAVIDRNEFVADIYIKPTKSINFITLSFVATSQGVDFSEIGS